MRYFALLVDDASDLVQSLDQLRDRVDKALKLNEMIYMIQPKQNLRKEIALSFSKKYTDIYCTRIFVFTAKVIIVFYYECERDRLESFRG